MTNRGQEFKKVYDKFLEVSLGLAAIPDCTYEHSTKLCYFGALIATSVKRVKLSQLPPGAGKSWLIVLLCFYYKTHTDLSPLIVTTEVHLQSQMRDYLEESKCQAKHVNDTELGE